MSKKILGYGLLAGIAMIVINFILNIIMNAIYPGSITIYENTEIFRSMNDPLMFLFWLYPLILGIGFAWIWNKSKKLFKAKHPCIRGLHFALIYLLVFAVPAFLINLGSFNLPILIVFTWTIMSFINGWVAGWVLAKLNK